MIACHSSGPVKEYRELTWRSSQGRRQWAMCVWLGLCVDRSVLLVKPELSIECRGMLLITASTAIKECTQTSCWMRPEHERAGGKSVLTRMHTIRFQHGKDSKRALPEQGGIGKWVQQGEDHGRRGVSGVGARLLRAIAFHRGLAWQTLGRSSP